MGKLRDIFTEADKLDEKSVSFLVKAIEKNNIEGFDYLEFKQAILHLRDMGIEEEVAIKSAFATASTMGLDKKKLMESADYYQKVLSAEREKFDQAHKKQLKTHVEDKKEKVESLKEKIHQLNEKIKQLEEKVTSYQDVIEKAKLDIDKASERIEDRKRKFENAYEQMHKEIETDKTVFDEKL